MRKVALTPALSHPTRPPQQYCGGWMGEGEPACAWVTSTRSNHARGGSRFPSPVRRERVRVRVQGRATNLRNRMDTDQNSSHIWFFGGARLLTSRCSLGDCGSRGRSPHPPGVYETSSRVITKRKTDMKRQLDLPFVFLAALAVAASPAFTFAAESARITVQTDLPGRPVPLTLHGLFFEDINYGADGGLYAELVQNRSFEDRESLYAWSEVASAGAKGRLTVEATSPLNTNNLHFLRIQVDHPGDQGYGAVNAGFDGIPLRAGDNYSFSVYGRRQAGEAAALRIALEGGSGRALTATNIVNLDATWKKFEVKLASPISLSNARLVVSVTRPGTVDVDMVSLFPENTFRGRRNGLRTDLAQLLADAKPGFLRFPGGCVVEGRDFDNIYRWKDTLGDIAERKQNWNLWQDPQSPHYNQTYGLGFFEYFLLCEDIGAEPVPVVNCGMCCQARRGPAVPLDQIGPYVQDALDLIEFANGPETSKWGARRAAMGHPKPFNLKFLAIGNEQWQQGYFDRYQIFYQAIKAKYPELQLITTSGPHPDDPLWKFAWDKFRSGTPADIVDEHYYRPPQWFLENHSRYDSYDRNGPKIFVGEYAAHDSGRRNNLRAAVAEAAYVTALWRNADVVVMASYAPLFAKIGHIQWRPDLIWFDNAQSFGSPSYYVQAMAGQNRPDRILPVRLDAPVRQPPPFTGRISVGTWRTQAEFKDILVTKDGRTLFQSDFAKDYAGWDTRDGKWSVVDGALRQTATEDNLRAYAGEPSWSDYTLSLKARKISGSEGFLVGFAAGAGNAFTCWNLGGWGNTQHGLEIPGAMSPYVPGHIETGRWYDIRIELKGATVKCYLDGQLVQQAASKPTFGLYAAAGRDEKSGETVLAVSNPGNMPMPTRINLAGTTHVAPKARAILLTSTSPDDENSFEQPGKVAPREESFRVAGPEFEHTFPAWSFTILRLATR
jgi:alpha-L-arabinofuranosidase